MAQFSRLSGEQLASCHYLNEDDDCYYARIRKAGGFDKSEANQLISNLKKDVSRRGKAEWYYKKQAALKFASELHSGLSDEGKKMAICFLPTSKLADHPEYDPRWEMISDHLLTLNPHYRIEQPVAIQQSENAYHVQANKSRNPSSISVNWVWKGFKNPQPQHIIVVDDVITTGGHFRAFKNLVMQNIGSGVHVFGFFWAKHEFDEPDPLEGFEVL